MKLFSLTRPIIETENGSPSAKNVVVVVVVVVVVGVVAVIRFAIR